MRAISRVLLVVCLSFNAVAALATPEAVVTPLVAKDLSDFKGKEGVVILVEYPQGLRTRPRIGCGHRSEAGQGLAKEA
jgi:hypothetical protein